MCRGGFVRVHVSQNMTNIPRILIIITIFLVASEASRAVLYQFVSAIYIIYIYGDRSKGPCKEF